MIDQSIQRFFILAWLFLAAVPFIPIYLKRSSITSKRRLLKHSLLFVLFDAVGIAAVEYYEEFKLTPSDFQLLLLIPGVLLGIFAIPPILDQVEVSFFQTIKLNTRGAYDLLTKSLKKMRAKITEESKNETLTAELRGPYGTDFAMKFTLMQDEGTRIVVGSKTGKSTATRFSTLYVLMLYIAVMVFSSNSTALLVPLFDIPYNGQIAFAVVYIATVLFMVTENSAQSNIFFALDEVQKEVLIEMAKQSQKKLAERKQKMSIKKPEVKMDLSTAKQKAEEIRQRQYKQELEERRKKMQERVKGVIGDNEEDKMIDPELLKRKILIDRTKTILKSTPVYKSVTLEAVAKKLEHENHEEVENIIIGLIDRKEIRGTYDIWEQIYYPGDTNAQFIESTLRKMNLDKEDLEFIKVNKAGDVEIRFKGNR